MTEAFEMRDHTPAMQLPIKGLSQAQTGIDFSSVSVVFSNAWELALELAFGTQVADVSGNTTHPLVIAAGDKTFSALSACIDGLARRRPDILDWQTQSCRQRLFADPCPLGEVGLALPHLAEVTSSVIVLCDAADVLLLDALHLAQRFERIARAAVKNWLAVLIVIHTAQAQNSAHELHLQLLRCRESIAGLAQISIHEDGIGWKTDFWSCLNRFSGEFSAPLTRISDKALGFESDLTDTADEISRTDENVILSASRKVTAQASALRSITSLEDNRALFEAGMRASAATLVFSLSKPADVPIVGRYIDRLRQSRGQHLKIAAVQDSQALRRSSLAFIYACGANCVFELAAGVDHIAMALLALKGTLYARAPIADMDAAVDALFAAEACGAVKRRRFLEIVRMAVKNSADHFNIGGTLVNLSPLPGVSPGECLEHFNPKRSGDIGCISGDQVLVFLNGCHPAYLELALKRVFIIDPAQLFAGFSMISDNIEILSALRRLQSDGRTEKDEASAAAELMSLTPHQDESPDAAHSPLLMPANPITPQALPADFLTRHQ